MAEVRFYTLGDTASSGRLKQVCLLVEQAFLAGERVLVWLDDAATLAQFDNLLWTFGDRSFVPHEMLGADPAGSEAPVQLHAGAELPAAALSAAFTTLVMLRETVSEEVLKFGRIVEVVDADPARRTAGRARFRYYREHGSAPQHIDLSNG